MEDIKINSVVKAVGIFIILALGIWYLSKTAEHSNLIFLLLVSNFITSDILRKAICSFSDHESIKGDVQLFEYKGIIEREALRNLI